MFYAKSVNVVKRLFILITMLLITAIYILPAIATTQNITYTYDNLDRLTSVSYGSESSITYEYDDAGNILKVAMQAGTQDIVDTDNDGIPDKTEDSNNNGSVDVGETDPIKSDSDGDGIQDGTELGYTLDDIGDYTDTEIFQSDLDNSTTTDPMDADSDDDGLTDGQEDSNHNGRVDAGETDPCNADTDNDGIFDGTEVGLTQPQSDDTDLSVGNFIPDADPDTTTDPNNPDSDGDGINDGDEDINKNGRVDTDQGESDAGAINVTVPDITGEYQASAETLITSKGLVVGVISEEYNNVISEGVVISQTPEAGELVLEGASVDIVVSLGCFKVIVPSLINLTEDEAVSLLNENNLSHEITYEITGQMRDHVISQLPAAGAEVCENSVISITVTGNNPPIANAGPDISDIDFGAFQLDGSSSSDLDGDLLSYLWIIISKPEFSLAELDNFSSVTPQINIDEYGSYEVELVVSDGIEDSIADTVIITTYENLAPVANAGDDLAVDLFEDVTLDGSSSYDPNSDEISFNWFFISKPFNSLAELYDFNTVAPYFTPDKEGEYELQLIVSDGYLFSEPDSIIIGVEGNVAPVADAGEDWEIDVGDEVCLDGGGSYDADEDEITFSWSIIARPESSITELDEPDNITACLVPDIAGEYVVQLIVNDGNVNSEPDTALITVEEIGGIPGDLDGNGVLDIADYYVFRLTLGKCEGETGFNADADYDDDGCITYNDYRIWYGYYMGFRVYKERGNRWAVYAKNANVYSIRPPAAKNTQKQHRYRFQVK